MIGPVISLLGRGNYDGRPRTGRPANEPKSLPKPSRYAQGRLPVLMWWTAPASASLGRSEQAAPEQAATCLNDLDHRVSSTFPNITHVVMGHVWTAPAVQGESDLSHRASRSATAPAKITARTHKCAGARRNALLREVELRVSAWLSSAALRNSSTKTLIFSV